MEGKKITIKYIEVSTYSLTEDGEFTCDHEFAEVTPPCCNGNDCGCYGSYSVYCPGCDNQDLTESEVEALLDTDYSEPDYE